jgi:hypothetical protein
MDLTSGPEMADHSNVAIDAGSPLVTELNRRFEEIQERGQAGWGIKPYEQLLEDLLQFVLSYSEAEVEFKRTFVELVHGLMQTSVDSGGRARPNGAQQTVDFCMHTLRWPEVRAELQTWYEQLPDTGIEFDDHWLAGRMLEAFSDRWRTPTIYRYYQELELEASTTDQLVRQYRAEAHERSKGILNGEPQSGKTSPQPLTRIYREVRRRGVESALTALLEDPDPGVRLWAGTHALEFAPSKGQMVLGRLASADFGPVSRRAELTLKKWREAYLRF